MRDLLRLTLLGGVSIQSGEEELTDNLFSKSQALFCYLVLTRTPQPRHAIAGLFWGDMPEPDARRNLRVNLTRMRRSLADYLHATRQTLAFDPGQPYWLDVEQFEAGIRAATTAVSGVDLKRLATAVDLYQGPFMTGLDVRDAPEFEEWVLMRRARYEQLAISALDTLVSEAISRQQYTTGIHYARRLLELDSWREEAHRQLMWLLELDGQHTAALAQYEQCRDILDRELGVEPAPETEALHAQILARREQHLATKALPPLPEETRDVPFQAPDLVAHFTGRDGEREQLRALLAPGDAPRAVALVGMGGVGKSSLAVQLAHDLRDAFPDGVLWANAATGDPKVIAEEWAAAFGYDFSTLPDMDRRGAALRSVLAEKTALLVLDDVVSAARVRPLLPEHGRCVTIVTTRNSQFARALGAERVRLRELTPAAGLELLTRIVGPDRVADEPKVASQICAVLQNLPLALTIAGNHLALRHRRPLADYAARLQDERQRLAALKLEDEEVRISFVISWQGLDDTQKRVFALLGVFAGRDFTAEAMAAVTGLNTYVTQDRLDDLVMLSMLSAETSQRYRQHPLLADFAREQLGRDDGAYLRLSQYFLGYAQAHQNDYAALRPEWENLAAGIEYAHRLHQWRLILDYSDALQSAWFARGRFTEARAAYRAVIEASMAIEDEQILARTQLVWGQACIEQGDYDQARGHLEQAETIYDAVEDPAGVASSRFEQARIANIQSNYAAAETLLDACLAARTALGDSEGIARVLTQRAWLYSLRGQNEEAVLVGEEALALLRQTGNTLATIDVLRLLADANRLLAQRTAVADKARLLNQAEQYLNEALDYAREHQIAGEEAAAYATLAGLYVARRDYDSAHKVTRKGLDILYKTGDLRGQAMARYTLANINMQCRNATEALTQAAQGLQITQQLGDRVGSAFLRQLMGDAEATLGHPEQAAAHWQRALNTARDLEQADLIASLSARLAGAEAAPT